MKLLSTKIKDIKKIKTKIFKDKRGFFKEIHKNKILKKKFIFDVMSYSKKGVLRGVHIQTKFPQAKLITVTSGKIMDVAVDLRKNSPTFGKYFSLIINRYINKEEHKTILNKIKKSKEKILKIIGIVVRKRVNLNKKFNFWFLICEEKRSQKNKLSAYIK